MSDIRDAEQADLQARIAALSGQINLHRHQEKPGAAHHHQSRWAPYNRGGRGGSFQRPRHQNRTLVLPRNETSGSKNVSLAKPDQKSLPDVLPASDAFVASRGKGVHQLMTKPTFEREQQQRMETFPSSNKNQKVTHLQQSRQQVHSSMPKRELEIDGIRFRVMDDGSKLVRLPGMSL